MLPCEVILFPIPTSGEVSRSTLYLGNKMVMNKEIKTVKCEKCKKVYTRTVSNKYWFKDTCYYCMKNAKHIIMGGENDI